MSNLPPNVSRLVITRRYGQGFSVGDKHLSLHHLNDTNVRIQIRDEQGNEQTVNLRTGKPLQLANDIVVELNHHPKHNTQSKDFRVMVLAPRDVKILRDELVANQ